MSAKEKEVPSGRRIWYSYQSERSSRTVWMAVPEKPRRSEKGTDSSPGVVRENTGAPSSGGGEAAVRQVTSPPQEKMRSRVRAISQTGGRRLGPWNRLRIRASACRAEPERGVERGV